MFALAQRPELWFPSVGRGHGSRRRLYTGKGKDRVLIHPGHARDCSEKDCRARLERGKGFSEAHVVGGGKNYDLWIEEHQFGEKVSSAKGGN